MFRSYELPVLCLYSAVYIVYLLDVILLYVNALAFDRHRCVNTRINIHEQIQIVCMHFIPHSRTSLALQMPSVTFWLIYDYDGVAIEVLYSFSSCVDNRSNI